MKRLIFFKDYLSVKVAPFAGAWIETLLPEIFFQIKSVAPFAGAWIETPQELRDVVIEYVAPFAGAWIETSVLLFQHFLSSSLLSQERGLKQAAIWPLIMGGIVAPFAGAWIETSITHGSLS